MLKAEQRVNVLEAEVKDLKFHVDCGSGEAECLVTEEYGFPCYRHLFEAFNDLQEDNKRLRKALANIIASPQNGRALADFALKGEPNGQEN